MTTIRSYDVEDISDSGGEVIVLLANGGTLLLPGQAEGLEALRLRLKVHTPQDPYTGGQILVTVRWHDGVSDREWNIALATTAPVDDVPNYAEQENNIWWDHSSNVTIQVSELVGPNPGTLDVRLIAVVN